MSDLLLMQDIYEEASLLLFIRMLLKYDDIIWKTKEKNIENIMAYNKTLNVFNFKVIESFIKQLIDKKYISSNFSIYEYHEYGKKFFDVKITNSLVKKYILCTESFLIKSWEEIKQSHYEYDEKSKESKQWSVSWGNLIIRSEEFCLNKELTSAHIPIENQSIKVMEFLMNELESNSNLLPSSTIHSLDIKFTKIPKNMV